MRSLVIVLAASSLGMGGGAIAAEPDRGPLRIICFGAHPDDCELKAAGVASFWKEKGHQVKFVSVTNGDIGHWRESGPGLAARRKQEVEAAAKVLGIETEVLDIHDGELEPTLEHRKTITRLIREWKADLVLTPRPNDYHPDHRYTAVLVQDAAYMVTVPKFLPDVPVLKDNPIFLYYPDGFRKPNPFRPDVIVAIDGVIETKAKALACLESQFYEGGANGGPELLSDDPAKQAARRAAVREAHLDRDRNNVERFRDVLATFYGPEEAKQIKFAEAFEVCEYGRRPDRGELLRLFPFFGEHAQGN